jgi:hypothetical protein
MSNCSYKTYRLPTAPFELFTTAAKVPEWHLTMTRAIG